MIILFRSDENCHESMYKDIVVQFVWYIYYIVGLYRQYPRALILLLPEVLKTPIDGYWQYPSALQCQCLKYMH